MHATMLDALTVVLATALPACPPTRLEPARAGPRHRGCQPRGRACCVASDESEADPGMSSGDSFIHDHEAFQRCNVKRDSLQSHQRDDLPSSCGCHIRNDVMTRQMTQKSAALGGDNCNRKGWPLTIVVAHQPTRCQRITHSHLT